MYECFSNETSSGIVVGEEIEAVKNITHGNEAGIPLAQQLMDPLCKFLQELLLEPLCLNGRNV